MTSVTLVGSAPDTTPLPEGEVWGQNAPSREDVKVRATRWFQMHPYGALEPAERQWHVEIPLGVAVYVLETWPGCHPNAIPFPLAEVSQGPFCSTRDYQMALAIHEGFGRVILIGHRYQSGYLRQRLIEHVSLAYWIGLARGKGIEVAWSPECDLLRFPLRYGYDYREEVEWARTVVRSALAEPKIDGVMTRCPAS